MPDETVVNDAADKMKESMGKLSNAVGHLNDAKNRAKQSVSSVGALKEGLNQIKKADNEFEGADEKAQDMVQQSNQAISIADAYKLVKQEEVDKKALKKTKAEFASQAIQAGGNAVGSVIGMAGDLAAVGGAFLDEKTPANGFLAAGGIMGAIGFLANKSDKLESIVNTYDALKKDNPVDEDVPEKGTPGAETEEDLKKQITDQYMEAPSDTDDYDGEEAEEKHLDVSEANKVQDESEDDIFNQSKDEQQQTLDDIAKSPTDYGKDAAKEKSSPISEIAGATKDNGEIDFDNDNLLATIGQNLDANSPVAQVTENLYENIPGGEALKAYSALKDMVAKEDAEHESAEKSQPENEGPGGYH